MDFHIERLAVGNDRVRSADPFVADCVNFGGLADAGQWRFSDIMAA